MTDSEKIALEHAREFFSTHASQRMQKVNFFLVAVAFIFAGFVQSFTKDNYFLALGIASIGVIVSFIFYKMDLRVRELIHAAEAPVKLLENKLAQETELEDISILDRVEEPGLGVWKYSKVFLYLYLGMATTFLIASAYSVWRIVSSQNINETPFYVVVEFVVGIVLSASSYETLSTPRTPNEQDNAGEKARQISFLLLGILTALLGLATFGHLVFYTIPNANIP